MRDAQRRVHPKDWKGLAAGLGAALNLLSATHVAELGMPAGTLIAADVTTRRGKPICCRERRVTLSPHRAQDRRRREGGAQPNTLSRHGLSAWRSSKLGSRIRVKKPVKLAGGPACLIDHTLRMPKHCAPKAHDDERSGESAVSRLAATRVVGNEITARSMEHAKF